MLILYDKNHNKSSPLTFAKNPKVERELPSGMETLSFYYPERKAHKLKPECYLRTKKQEFVIKEINNQTSQWLYVVAKVNTESIKGKAIENYEVVNATITDAINLCLTGTGWTLEYTDIVRRRTVRKSNCNSEDVLDNIRSTFRAEFMFDAINKRMYAFDMLGEDKGVYFSDELNLKKLTLQSHTYDFCTKIIPIGKDGIKISNVNGGIEYIENHQYSDKIITMIWEDNRYTDPEALKEDATVKLAELSTPMNAYLADIYDLAKMNPKYKNILDYSLGDTITLVDKETRVKEKHRIIKTTEYLDEPELNSCEIANRLPKFENMQNNFLDATETLRTVTTPDGLIDDYKVNLDPIRQEFGQIVAEKADFTDLQAAAARIGNLEATSATITQLDTEIARINDLYTIKANVGELTAAVGRISILESDVASIDTILSKAVFAELAEFGQILAGSGIIAEGAIGSAQISDLSASKLSAGIADLAILTIQGTDGRLKIANNRLQVFSGTTQLFERVALGDVHGNGSEYGLLVRGPDGQTTLFDNDGLTDKGFTDGYNRLDDNSLNPVKLDIAQVVTRINEGTTTIESSKIYMDNKTLDVAISSIETTVSDHGQSIISQSAQITALDSAIQFKVDTQTYTSDLEGINSQLSTQSASISALQGEVAIKVTQTDINNAVNPLDTRIASAEGTLITHATQIAARVTTTEFQGLESRVNTAEQKITDTAIISTVLSSTAYINDLGEKVNSNSIISTINQSAEAVLIQASKINLAGAVTVSAFASDVSPYVTQITNTTLQTTDIIAENLKVNAANIGGQLTAAQVLIGQENIIEDPNFLTEHNLIGATSGGSTLGWRIVSSSAAFTGNTVVQFRPNGQLSSTANLWFGKAAGSPVGWPTVTEGDSLYLEAMIRRGLAGDTHYPSVRVILRYRDVDGNILGSVWGNYIHPQEHGTSWVKSHTAHEDSNSDCNYIAPPGTYYATFQIQVSNVNTPNSAMGTIYVGAAMSRRNLSEAVQMPLHEPETLLELLHVLGMGTKGIRWGAPSPLRYPAFIAVADKRKLLNSSEPMVEMQISAREITLTSDTVNMLGTINTHGELIRQVGAATRLHHPVGDSSVFRASPTAGRQWIQLFCGSTGTGSAGGYISLYGPQDSGNAGVVLIGAGGGNAIRLDINRNARFYGNLQVDGTKAATVVTDSYGKREMYALETPDNRFVAYIEKNLPEGENWIEICPMFLETISEYFIVPHVQNASDVIVLEREKSKFRVWVKGHRAEVVFEVNGKRKGFEHIYMEPVPEDKMEDKEEEFK